MRRLFRRFIGKKTTETSQTVTPVPLDVDQSFPESMPLFEERTLVLIVSYWSRVFFSEKGDALVPQEIQPIIVKYAFLREH